MRKRPSVLALLISFGVFVVFAAATWPFIVYFSGYFSVSDIVMPTLVALAIGALLAAFVPASLDDISFWPAVILMGLASLPAALVFSTTVGVDNASSLTSNFGWVMVVLVAFWAALVFVPFPTAHRRVS